MSTTSQHSSKKISGRGRRAQTLVVWTVPVLLIWTGVVAPAAGSHLAPIGVTATAAADGGSILLQWARPGQHDQATNAWEVWRGIGSERLSLLVTLTGAVTSHVDADVDPSGSYYYRIRSLNGGGYGPWSDLTWARTPDPARPDLLTEGFDNGAAAWSLSGLWGPSSACVSPVAGAAHLAFHVAADPCHFGSGVIAAGRATTMLDLSGVRDATLLFENHRAVEALGRAGSDRMQVRIVDGASETIVASWDAASPHGRLWKSEAVDLTPFAGRAIGLVFAFDTVDAVDNVGAGWNLDALAVRGTPKTVPTAVDDLVAESGPAAEQVLLSWTDPANDGDPIVTYEILRGTSAETLEALATITTGEGTGPERAFIDDGLPPGIRHHYAVRATNALGTGALSNIVYGAAFGLGAEPSPLPYATTLTSAVWDGVAGFVFGGLSDPQDGESLDGVVRFDPVTGSSEPLNVTLPSGRHATSAAWVPEAGGTGRAYVFFGESHTNGSSGEMQMMGCHPSCLEGIQIIEFDPLTNDMSVVPIDDPDLLGRYATSASYVPPQYDETGALVNGTGVVWVIGGTESDSGEISLTGCHPSCFVGEQLVSFEPLTQETSVVSFSDDEIHARTGTSSVYVPAEFDDAGQVPGTGLVYIFGGDGGHAEGLSLQGCHPSCLTDVQILGFDPVTQDTSVMPVTLPIGVSFSSATYDGDHVYIFGGNTSDGPTDAVQRFDPVAQTIEVVGTLSADLVGTSAISTPWGMYVFGGDDGNSSSDQVQEFDPLAPRDTNATAGPASGEIRLSWREPVEKAGVIGYRIYAGRGLVAETRIAEVPANVTTFVLDVDPATGAPLGRNETWSFKVSAFTVDSEGPQGLLATATTFDLPGVPRDLTARNDIIADAIVLDWIAPADDGGTPITTYLLERVTSPIASRVVIEVGLDTTYTDRGCTAGLICTYRVAAENIVGRSEFSDPAASGIGTPP